MVTCTLFHPPEIYYVRCGNNVKSAQTDVVTLLGVEMTARGARLVSGQNDVDKKKQTDEIPPIPPLGTNTSTGGPSFPDARLWAGDSWLFQRAQLGGDQQPAAGGARRARGAGGAVGAGGDRAAGASRARGCHRGVRCAFQVPHGAGMSMHGQWNGIQTR